VKKRIDVVAVLLFLVALALVVAAAKTGSHHGGPTGFFNGG
jgi:hypothetical protein